MAIPIWEGACALAGFSRQEGFVPEVKSVVSFSLFYAVVGGYFRRRRLRWVMSAFRECNSVVDLGGTPGTLPPAVFHSLTLVNLAGQHPLAKGSCFLQADACHVPLDGPFDLAYSNSVIEHVGSWERQREFTNKMLRLGRRVYCQTPNRWFPVETHYLTAFLHWLPRRWFGYGIHRWLTLQGLCRRPSRSQSLRTRQRESVRLLSKRELQQLFPGCQIKVERFLGWPKSYAAWR